MRIRKLALLAAALSMPLAGSVLAADAIMEQPPEPPIAEVLPQSYIWAGGYLGGYGEYKWGEFDAIPGSADGFGGGLYSGYNWQSDNIVYGVEADVGYSWADGAAAGVAGEQGFNGSLRARLGMDVNPFLIYATGGVAATRAELTSAAGSDNNTHFGWTAGAGAEAFVTEKITTRLEYRYTDYQSKNYNLGGTNVSSGFDDHSVRLGIGMKF
ncbi:MAG: porin family protein [Hoeflea sp.]|uniref:outer membrane protein n=1 Tax=Hoeflea sp. TaxID=1940281 RepID=UPI001DD156F2|nr:porin family protein [Hoeflea sp.]MBU4530085.1 porin family protein [Alphaproteobacteria bacterium]MBU4542630.1 porin family protein [Alphaproteobacteria bacterium]MBU4551311.1 porin family protein [Alphaproteobacteria bacterium]MBV1723134.1 porin family protein [Hoeflea sp.]MBV1760145.1 porin family protein [Hoeflea sp.]